MNVIVYRKQHKIKISSISNKTSSDVKYGFFGLKAVTSGILTSKQLEATRRVVSRETKRTGKIFIRVFFILAITKKPLMSRMGKGSGPIKGWVAIIKKGMILLELSGVNERNSISSLKTAGLRLPLKVIVVSRAIYRLN